MWFTIDITNYKAEIETLNNAISELKTTKQSYEAEIENHKNGLKTLEEKLSSSQKDCEDIRQQLQQKCETNTELEKGIIFKLILCFIHFIRYKKIIFLIFAPSFISNIKCICTSIHFIKFCVNLVIFITAPFWILCCLIFMNYIATWFVSLDINYFP